VASERVPAHIGASALDEIFDAIDDEIVAAARDPARSTDVRDGVRLHRGISGALYAFRVEQPPPFQPETPVELAVRDARIRGVLVTTDDFDVVVHLQEDIGQEVPAALLTSNPTFILERLKERLESVVLRPSLPTGGVPGATWQPEAAIVGGDESAAASTAEALSTIDDPGLQPNPSQRLAMSRAGGSNVHFVWGPPGTGKTAALAQVARMLADRGERLLVAAHANVAVDVAMMRVADAFVGSPDLEQGRILRVGDPHHVDARERREILVETAIERRAPALAEERQQLESRRESLARALRGSRDDVERDQLAADLRGVRERLATIRKEYRDEASRAIAEAQVVGTTLSRFVLSDDVWEWRPDALLLDEASMVSFPWVLAAATRVSKRLTVYGDFRQLPPVYLAQSDVARRWLGADVFEIAGVRTRVDDGVDDPRVTLLETQYRMATQISDVVSELAYSGRLQTADSAALRGEQLAKRQPMPGESLVVIDTSELAATCQVEAKPGSFSRVNPLHVVLAFALLPQFEIAPAVIAPYRAQTRLHAAAILDSGLSSPTAATIHRYQGSERDAVLFDLVDARPIDGPSRLTGGDLDLALRLFNVAVSRARGKAILLVDKELLMDRFAPTSPVRRGIELCVQRGVLYAPSPSQLSDLASDRVEWLSGRLSVLEALEAMLGQACSSVVLNVPNHVEARPETVDALASAAARSQFAVVLGPHSLLAPLEELPIDLRLLPGPGFLAIIDQTTALVGGSNLEVAARLVGPRFAAALESALIGRRSDGPISGPGLPALAG
jgi:hypothetical protein